MVEFGNNFIVCHTKFGDNISNGGRVFAIFRFSKWRPTAILHFAAAQKRTICLSVCPPLA